jgi:phage FluMu protein Com
MNYQDKNYNSDYRVNILNNGTIISIEITCCGKHIGEMRFKDGENKKCPFCGTVHSVKIEHNHFHIRPVRTNLDDNAVKYGRNLASLEGKAL